MNQNTIAPFVFLALGIGAVVAYEHRGNFGDWHVPVISARTQAQDDADEVRKQLAATYRQAQQDWSPSNPAKKYSVANAAPFMTWIKQQHAAALGTGFSEELHPVEDTISIPDPADPKKRKPNPSATDQGMSDACGKAADALEGK